MITLTSDFGSPYPAAMKGVICQHSDARLVDIAHDLPRQDVRAAAFWLTQTLPYFPPAVHCVVVDPGVGTDRAALALRAGDHALVGPDNGVLLPAARRLADEVEVFRWAYEDPESATFHGRDVFAPAAATVHNHGVAGLDELPRASRTDGYVDRRFPDPTVDRDGARGEVLVVDEFGNAITNVSGEELRAHGGEAVTVNGLQAPVRRAYAGVEAGEPLVTVGSHGNVELAVNRGRGDDAFGVAAGDDIELRW
ncbi:SAM-dependent chlorinase/fluorinase [Halomicroarcula sp. F28]|uniref:SAM hydrolase/SAM-dependent halogenase family protein n=1 Tax=Haloarcula salinisoli TaxID=2487746 RepID=UPI001C7382DD|nr:SAM-dependent chlorinase/fluorinase [Halomicroarcula salinisoli]MBX0286149.1 SAM-dependent chlorinase/fluorinase [Halomicroarcula salinisoli]